MHKIWVIVLWSCLPYLVFSQTGPGGVGLRDGSSSLELWMDVDKGITTTNNSGSGGSATDVTNWTDQSGNNLSMTGTGTQVPAYISGFVNGHGAMQFAQSNFERLNLSNTIVSIGASDNRTLLYVFKFTGNVNNCEIMGTETGKSVDYGTFSVTNDRLRLRNLSSNVYSAANSVTQDAWHVGTLQKNATAVNAWNDNTSIINTTGDYLDWPVSNSFDLGAANFNTRSFQGEITELIIYSTAINTAQRIILNNYLAAKYGITLSALDIYNEDNAGSDFDYEVAGIGRVDASNLQNDSQGTGIVRILNATDLGDNEFFIWGHNNGDLSTANTTDVPPGVQVRLSRLWRVSEVNTSGTAIDVGGIDVQFDLSSQGTVVASDLRLLVDTDNDGTFADETAIGGATSLGSNVYAFTNVSAIGNDMRFTVGSINKLQTPLPVELVSFNIYPIEDHNEVGVKWTTDTEIQNDYFTVERSADGRVFREVERVAGANTSSDRHSYTITDKTPLAGLSYYRLKQTDLDSNYKYLGIRSIEFQREDQVVVSPNPLQNSSLNILINSTSDRSLEVRVISSSGQQVYSERYTAEAIQGNRLTIDLPSEIGTGIYIVQLFLNHRAYNHKIFIEQTR
jgi:hypothetical protein